VEAGRLPAQVADGMRARMVENARRHRAGTLDQHASTVVSEHAVWADVMDDLTTMQNGWRVTGLSIHSPKRLAGRPIVKAKSLIQRAIHPLPARQTDFNLAANRLISHLISVTGRQARAIERLQAEVDELTREIQRRG
jgi:hypothetical protein